MIRQVISKDITACKSQNNIYTTKKERTPQKKHCERLESSPQVQTKLAIHVDDWIPTGHLEEISTVYVRLKEIGFKDYLIFFEAKLYRWCPWPFWIVIIVVYSSMFYNECVRLLNNNKKKNKRQQERKWKCKKIERKDKKWEMNAEGRTEE